MTCWKDARRVNRTDVAIVRLEQFYPLPEAQLASLLRSYPDGTPVYWVQEEPENMGAWRYLRVHFCGKMFGRYPFHGITRPTSASPATGSSGCAPPRTEGVDRKGFGRI